MISASESSRTSTPSERPGQRASETAGPSSGNLLTNGGRQTGPALDAGLDEKPFRLAKSFAMVAIGLILAGVLTLAAVVSHQAEIIITKRVEDDTIKLMENLNHQMYENFLKRVGLETGRSRLREPAQQALLHEVITNTIHGFDIQRVLIYDPEDGRVVYATDKTLLNSVADDHAAYQEAVASYVPTRPQYETLPWWAGGGYNLYLTPFSPNLGPLPPGLGEDGLIQAPESGGGQNRPGLNLEQPRGEGALLPRSERTEASDYSWLLNRRFVNLETTSSISGTVDLSGNEEDAYMENLRAQTVFRYEGGSFLALNFFPRGDFVLRSYKAMEDYGPLRGLSGVLEVDRNLTPEYRQIARLQYFSLSMAFFLALVLNLVLWRVVSRGEAIITKRNLERQALRERLDQAERLAGLGSMVATVAHEIRNPLGIIHSTADVLNRFLAAEPDRARLAAAIVEEANRLSEVVTEFLDFARPPTPRLTPVVVEEILEEILAFLEVTLTRAGVEVRCDFRAEETPIPGDGPMLHRAFLNILVNAIQAMDDGGLICVGTRLEDRDGQKYLLITISDTGPGLSDEAIKKQFSPFYTTKAKGTGLGLVIVRNIIEGHGGEIELKNGPPPQDKNDGGPGLTACIRLKAGE